MKPEQVKDIVLSCLEEKKAENILVHKYTDNSYLFDHAIIASGRSSRNVSAIADYIGQMLKDKGLHVTIKGLNEGNWVLLDCSGVITHVFQPEVRNYYNLEEILQKH